MQLGVRDVAKLLQVSDKTIYRWLAKGSIPAFKVGDQYRFSRAEVLAWATARKVAVSANIFHEAEADDAPPRLAEALRAGGVHYRVEGCDVAGVLAEVVEHIRLPDEVDRAYLLQVLLAREALGSTGIGDGIALPHQRAPVVMHVGRPTVHLGFLDKPIDFHALDGKPVHTVFTIVSPTIRAHIQLLSRIAFALRHPGFADVVARQAGRGQILAAAEDVDALSRVPARAGA